MIKMVFIRFFTLLIFTAGSSLSFAAGVKLCKPLSTSADRDEIGGLFSDRLDEYIAALDRAAVLEKWMTVEDSKLNPPANSCTRIAFKGASRVFLQKNIFGHQPSHFFRALEKEKRVIMEFYKSGAAKDHRIELSDLEYNRLAYLAAGIMGAESSAGHSGYYYIEHIASKLSFLERLAVCLNDRTWERCTTKPITSRGLTQIKKVPFVGEIYGINRDNLYKPYLSGVATMGFLIETYKWLQGVVRNRAGSDEAKDKLLKTDDFEVLLTYMYRGDQGKVFAGTADLDKSCYFKRVQKFQEYIRFYIVPGQDCSEAGTSILDKESSQ